VAEAVESRSDFQRQVLPQCAAARRLPCLQRSSNPPIWFCGESCDSTGRLSGSLASTDSGWPDEVFVPRRESLHHGLRAGNRVCWKQEATNLYRQADV